MVEGLNLKVVCFLIKMCGIMSLEDVVVVVRVGVIYIGMIVWFKFKRFVIVSFV